MLLGYDTIAAMMHEIGGKLGAVFTVYLTLLVTNFSIKTKEIISHNLQKLQ
jgi:hypothetical protein